MVNNPTKSFAADAVEDRWWLIDVQDAVLGRAATQIATILRGKHRPTFTPHADTGDHVVVINAATRASAPAFMVGPPARGLWATARVSEHPRPRRS